MNSIFKIFLVLLRHDLPIWAVGLLTNWLPDNRYTIRLRGALYRPFIFKCGKGFACASNVQLKGGDRLTIGENCYFASGVWLNAMGGMEIGDEVIFGPYVVISTGTHTFKDGSVKRGGTIMSKVAIGRGSWLAAHASVRAGSSVGSGVIVGANAVVTKDTEDNVVVGGVPAKVLGPRRDAEEGVDVKYSRF